VSPSTGAGNDVKDACTPSGTGPVGASADAHVKWTATATIASSAASTPLKRRILASFTTDLEGRR
jgi:hypothetical protein